MAYVQRSESMHSIDELLPEEGVRFGVDVASAELSSVEELAGRRFYIERRDFYWDEDFTKDPRVLHDLNVANVVPLITWAPFTTTIAGAAHGNINRIPLSEIEDGTHDEMIRQRAEGAKALKKPFFLRWAHEPNGNWFPWSGFENGGEQVGPHLYISAYKKIRRIFANAGATNVAFVWSPNAVSVPDDDWNHWERYYPGDDYVDWIGINGYNWDDIKTGTTWTSFVQTVQPIYDFYENKKPIMVSETGSVEGSSPGDKAQWIRYMKEEVPKQLPQLRIILWENIITAEEQADMRINSSDEALEAFRELVSDPYFQH